MNDKLYATKYADIAKDLPNRYKKLQKILNENGIDALLICGNSNLIYTTGTILDGYFYLTANGKARIFLRSGQPISNEIELIHISRPEMIPQILGDIGESMPKRIALEYDEISHRDWVRLSKLFQDAEIVDVPVLRQARATKTETEVEIMRRDGARHTKMYEMIPRLYKKGMTDADLEAVFLFELHKVGHLGDFRTFGHRMEPIHGTLLAGENACAAAPFDYALGGQGLHPTRPLGANGDVLKDGTTVMMDIAGHYNGYVLDVSRTYSIGKLSDQAYDLHKIGLEIQHEVANMGKIGVLCSELYEKAQSIVTHYHVEEYFMGCEKQAKFIGHGVGIEINELPVITGKYKQPLCENMTIALEPKFALPGVGALGIENSYVVRANGMENLTECNEEIIDLLD